MIATVSFRDENNNQLRDTIQYDTTLQVNFVNGTYTYSIPSGTNKIKFETTKCTYKEEKANIIEIKVL